jgi:hypothetical protein
VKTFWTRLKMRERDKPRIFHGFFNIAGIPGALAKAERDLGYVSHSVCFGDGYFKREVDEVISAFSMDLFINSVKNYEVFNFHFGHSFFETNLKDIKLLKRAGKSVFMHFHGCDIRDSKKVIEKYPLSACQVCWPMQCSANRSLARKVAAEQADATFVYTPDLLEFVPGSYWLPQPVELEIEDIECSANTSSVVRVAHAPTSTGLKGSRHIIEAVNSLQKDGYEIELNLITGMPRDQVVTQMQASDIIIDQLLIGAYGVVSIEGMLSGKPIICYIRDDLRSVYGDQLPIINATPENIQKTLANLIENREDWGDIAKRGKEYAQQKHLPKNVATQLSRFY